MTTTQNNWQRYCDVLLAAGMALIGVACVPPGGSQSSDAAQDEPVDVRHVSGDICGKTTQQLFKACGLAAREDAQVASANCLNLTNPQVAEDCISAAEEARDGAVEECAIVREARDQVCVKLGGGVYDPVIDPKNFVAGITNRYTPFPVGAVREYEKQTPEGLETIRIEVLPETRKIMGVTVTTLRDTVKLNGVLVEDTKDWLAQDTQDNVWYMGEIVQKFENGLLENLDGSFEAGKAGAKAGFWTTGAPQVGDFYRQEWALSVAEDVVEVLDLDSKDPGVPFSGNDVKVLKVRATTPMSPVVEIKYYVPGIGFVLEVKPATGEVLKLVRYSN